MEKRGLAFAEIAIIITIIILLSAIIIPNLMTTKINANEQMAMASARKVYMALKNFASVNNGQYPQNLSMLNAGSRRYIDVALAQAVSPASANSGYYFSYFPAGGSLQGFWVSVEPASPDSGPNFYYIDEQGIICKGSFGAKSHAASGLECPEYFNPVK